MSARFNLLVMAAFFSSTALLSPGASAQDDEEGYDDYAEEEESAGGTDEAEAEEGESEEGGKDDEPLTREEEQAVDEALASDSPVELPGKTYYLVGLRYRGILIPKFMMNLFGDGGRTVYVDSIGPELGIRKDGFEYIFSIWWADYGMEDTPFKASDDDDDAWEIVESKINVLYLTADFLWSHDFSPEFALNYGMGAGFGFVWGPLYRTQAYPPPGVTDPYEYEKCIAEGFPNARYCGGNNDHYDDYEEPNWSGGGSKPVIFPWFAIQTGLRVKPHRNFVARVDLGFGISGFFFGLGLDYGI
jgi:hypothetical protein